MCNIESFTQTATARKKAGATDCDSDCDWGATELQPVAPGRTQSHSVTPSRSNFFPPFWSKRRERAAPGQFDSALVSWRLGGSIPSYPELSGVKKVFSNRKS